MITVQYTADGVTHAFAFPFWLARPADLGVLLGTTRQTAGYVVAILTDQPGGAVTFATPPAAGTLVTLTRDTETVRRSLFVDGGTIAAGDLNREYDAIYAILQEIAARLGAFITVWPTPAGTRRGLIMTPAAALTLTLEDPDVVAARASSAAAQAAAAYNIASQALAQTRPEGAALNAYQHTLVAGTAVYQCAEPGLGAPSVNNVAVYYDRIRLLPTIDYTLAGNGETIVLTREVVAETPTPAQFKAGQSLFVLKIAGGLVTPDLSPGSVATQTLADKAVTAAKEADGVAKAIRAYDATGRPAALTGAPGQVIRFDDASTPVVADPLLASADEVRAGVDATKAVTAATAGYNLMAPLFIGCWWRRESNGVMNVAFLRQTIGGSVTCARTGPGKYTLSHPPIVWQVPLLTFVSAGPVGAVSYRVTTDARDTTLIETYVGMTAADCDVIIAMHGVPQ